MADKNYKLEIKKLGNAEIEIDLQISAEKLAEQRKKIVKRYKENLELPGFRKGNAPEKMIIEKVGEARILEDAAEEAIKEIYPQILLEHKIEAIGRPEVTITKLALGNELGVKIKTSIVPEVKLADYKKIASEDKNPIEEDPEVGDDEVEKVIDSVRQARKKEDGKLPELDQNFVKELGNFTDLEDLKQKIKQNLKEEKKHQQKNKKRTAILEKIIKDSEIELPEILVRGELEKMLAQFKEEIEVAGMSFKDYLEKTKADEEKIRRDWRPQAEKRAQSQLVLNKIAAVEKITADPRILEQEVEKVIKEYPGADRNRAEIFVETILINTAVLEFLENQQ